MIARLLILFAFLFAVPAAAQTYPPLTGRVVDTANLLDPGQEAALTARLEALEQASTRQLVILTVPSLEGQTIEEYGIHLAEAWRIGQRGADNGAILIVAVEERKIRIEVGQGLEGIMTDALSSRIIREKITPRFREQDYPGGINAGVDAIIEQLQAPPEAAEARAREAAQSGKRGNGGSAWTLIFWIVVIGFIIIFSIIRGGVRGRRYRRRGIGAAGDWVAPIVIWGAGLDRGGGSSWGGGGGSSWGGGGGGWGGGGGGGFSGGGGSFGGGGASGGW